MQSGVLQDNLLFPKLFNVYINNYCVSLRTVISVEKCLAAFLEQFSMLMIFYSSQVPYRTYAYD
jgi:hypothetical protein